MNRILGIIRVAVLGMIVGFPLGSQAMTVKFLDLGGDVFTDALTPGLISQSDATTGSSDAASVLAGSRNGRNLPLQTLTVRGLVSHSTSVGMSVLISETDYVHRSSRAGHPLLAIFGASGSVRSLEGNGSMNVTWTSWIDPSNTLFGQGYQLARVNSNWTGGAMPGPTHNFFRDLPLVDGQSYAITQRIDFSGSTNNHHIGDTFDFDLTVSTRVVPLPASFPMLLGGLVLMGWGGYRRVGQRVRA